jgi:hypothetical protein
VGVAAPARPAPLLGVFERAPGVRGSPRCSIPIKGNW